MHHLLGSRGMTPFWTEFLSKTAVILIIALSSWLLWWLTFKIVFGLLRQIVKKTPATWDDELLERRGVRWLAWLVPAFFINGTASWLPAATKLNAFLTEGSAIIIITGLALALTDFLSFLNALYMRRKEAARRPIKGIIQAAQVCVIAAAVIIAFSDLSNKSVKGLLTGLGAVSAVLMLIFQEPIKGLVAGFQISSNDMVHIGDWIEVPSQGADGDVIDISLLSVTVRNWDKTYVTFPIQAITSKGFKNWRGMDEAGGRRIKRSLLIDLSSIHFLSSEDIERLSSISLLKNFLKEKTEEIRQWNEQNKADRNASPVNGRCLTNLGVFRAYAQAYISSHPKTHPDLTMMVRQLQSGPEGLPLEIYLFSADQVWSNYEAFQSDIFEHLFAVLPEFGLRAFQNPSGSDLNRAFSRK